DHVWRNAVLDGHAHERVGVLERLRDSALVGLDREALLIRIHALLAPLVDDAFGVAHDDVLALDAQGEVEVGARDGGRPAAAEHDADFLDVLANDLERVQKGRAADHGSAVLVVVENGNLKLLLELLLNVETLGSFDVLKVDAAEGRFEHLASADDVV